MCVRLATLVAAAAFLLPLCTPVRAATLTDIQGEVLVDRGGGFDVVIGATGLNPGDTVIANPGSFAHIVYNSNCKVPVRPGAVIAVRQKPPCNESGAVVESSEVKPEPEIATEGGGGGLNATTLLVGGAVVGLGAAAAVLLTQGGDDSPASP